jgi:alpha-ketoglutarate-dependent taurine dioxygenase
VVFFRSQNNLTNELQKVLITRLGQLSGRPASSGLHIHPLLNSERELGGNDPEVSSISSKQHSTWYNRKSAAELAASGAKWHSDISFEPVPADFSSLRLIKLPKTGGGMLCVPSGLLELQLMV